MDVLLPVGDQLIFGLGNPDDAVQAYQDDRDDDGGLDLDVSIHRLSTGSLTVAAREAVLSRARQQAVSCFLFLTHQTRHGAARHLQLYVVGLYPQYQRIILIHTDDGP